MAEAPAQTPLPRVFSSASLSDVDLQTITELANYLHEHPYDFNSHLQLINLLHQGFVSHIKNPSTDPSTAPNPVDYSLLSDLRQAREAMDSKFAIGEDLWKDWIEDESIIARSSEERNNVVELCMRAVQEEPVSVTLWRLYGEWVWSTYAIANDFIQGDGSTWTEEDKIICKEVFTRELVLTIWEQAANATKWRVDESHLIWNRYAELAMQNVPERPSPKAVDDVQTLFMMRLQVPHAAWDATLQNFWPFISKYNSHGWEEIMAATNEMAGPAKQAYTLRETHELNLTQATKAGDQSALYDAFVAYLAWEAKFKKRKGPFDTDLRISLYERALLRFPSIIEWWLDYADFLVTLDSSDPAILSVFERATRHCPWSGELWSRRLLRVEFQHKTYDDVQGVKHKATNSGLMENGGMEEVMKVYTSWCSYLRRRAFDAQGTDDDVDMADMGILGTLEDVSVAGKKLYGDNFKGDPLWRIEKIHVKFLTQARRITEAREFWRTIIPSQSGSYDFWFRYYQWEIFIWGTERMIADLRTDAPDRAPRIASAVLREAMSQKTLDWPEKLFGVVEHHFEMFEMPAELQQAQIDLRAARKRVQYRREAEAAAAASLAAETAQQAAPEPVSEDNTGAAGKRKRDEELIQNGDGAVKRNKVAEEESSQPAHHEVSSSASAQAKRDREHTTITVKNLPADITEKRIRQFFADCGTLVTVSILAESNDMAATATIEFESREDVLSAKTRDGKTVDGNEIRIQSGTDSTLYVANFPPDFDEVKIRELFDTVSFLYD